MAKQQTSFLDIVKYLYVYFFSAVGTIMIIMGVYKFGEFAFNSYISGEYQLQPYREERCDYLDAETTDVKPLTETGEEMTPEEKKTQYDRCIESLSEERVYQQKRDIFDASMLVGLGLIIFGIHFGWMRKRFLS